MSTVGLMAGDILAALMKHDTRTIAELCDYTQSPRSRRDVPAYLRMFESCGVVGRLAAVGVSTRDPQRVRWFLCLAPFVWPAWANAELAAHREARRVGAP